LKIAALDKILYGNCHFQAPVVVTRTRKQWVLDKQATLMSYLAMRPQKMYKTVSKPFQEPTIFNRNVFEMYPYPYSTSTQDGEGIFHRPFISEYELVELSKKDGFDKAAIKEILKAGASEQNYDDGMETKQQARGYTSGKRKGYDLLYYCGKFDAKDLAGADIPDFKDMRGFVEMMAWIINSSAGPRVIKIVPNPLTDQKRPFYSSVYERVPHEIMGVGVGENALDSVELIKGAVRLFIDSKKMSLPMLAVDPAKRTPGTTLEFRPFKIFQFNGRVEDFIKQFQFKDTSDGLITLIELAERFADEISGIPKWTTGGNQRDYTKTATGLGMLMNAQGQLMRGAIENFDDFIIEPIGEAFYDWNMENNPNQNIKGDFRVRANGLSSMMAKEVLNQQLMQMISFVINPTVMQNPAAVRILRIIGANAQIPNVDEILPSPDELRAFAAMSMAQAQGRIAGVSAPPAAGGMSTPVIGPEASSSAMSAAGTGAMS
jgi:hypothetical protein